MARADSKWKESKKSRPPSCTCFDLSSWTEGIIIFSLFGDVRGERPRSPHSSPPASKNLRILARNVPPTKVLDERNHAANMELDTKIVLTCSHIKDALYYIELHGPFMSL